MYLRRATLCQTWRLAAGLIVVCLLTSAVSSRTVVPETKPQLELHATVVKLGPDTAELLFSITNKGARMVTLDNMNLPWFSVGIKNFIVARDSEVITPSIAMSVPTVSYPLEPTFLFTGKSVTGGIVKLRNLTPGHYDVVGLLFCGASVGNEGTMSRVALPLHLTFVFPEPQRTRGTAE